MPNTIVFHNARFTILTPHLIRIEYSGDGNFIDQPTLFAQNRKLGPVEYETKENGRELTIITEAVTLTYVDDKSPFCAQNLKARIHTGGVEADWAFGMETRENLKGPIPTLDGVEGWKELPDGLLSRDGWYLLDDSAAPVFEHGWISKRPAGNEQDGYLFAYGHDYKLALRTLSAVSGKMALPRKYTFGSWYSRWWPYTADEFVDIVDEYDLNNFPLDILVIDMDWHYNDWTFDETQKDDPHQAKFGYGWADGNMGWTGYSWNRNLIADPERLLSELHAKGVYVTLNDHPCDGVRDHEDLYPAFMKALGHDPSKKENLRYDAGDKTYMDTLFDQVHSTLENQGVDFWWVDWQQDSLVPTVKDKGELRHLPWLNYLYYQHSKQNNKRGISFSRWGGFGDQKHPIYFSGDTFSTWDTLAFEIYFTLVSGNCGCFFWSHDIGGFAGDRNPELYVRWVQFGLTSAAMRVHSMRDEALDRRPWKWGAMECDAMRKMFHLRSQLLPYIYSSAYESYEQSVPLLRPMYLEYPEDEEAYQNKQQYFFGSAFLAAPVTTPGEGAAKVASQTVWIKEGTYYNFFTGEKVKGEGNSVSIKSDLFSFPLLVKAGVPIPMQPYQSRMASADLKELVIRCYPGEDGAFESFVLYEDDGISQDFEKNVSLKTTLAYHREGDLVTVSVKPEGIGYDGMPDKRDYTIELPLIEEGLEIISASHPAQCDYYTDERMNVVSLLQCKIKEPVSVTLRIK